jgi:hypothetical protein
MRMERLDALPVENNPCLDFAHNSLLASPIDDSTQGTIRLNPVSHRLGNGSSLGEKS